MGKTKLIAYITCGVLFASAIGSTAIISNKTNNISTKIENHVLLSAPATMNQAVVINTKESPLVLYSEPNSNASISSYISIGEMLTYQKTNSSNFYKVTVAETGATGYISSNNIQIIESGLNQAVTPMNKQGQVINVTRNVVLRSQPDMQGSIMGNYKNNMPITLLGKQGQWYKISISGQTGYMYQEYVGIDNSSNATANSNSRNINNTTVASNSNGVIKNSSTTPIKTMNLKNIQNIISNQMGEYFKNLAFAQKTPTKDLDVKAIYQTAQAIIPKFVTKNALQNIFKLNGPTYSNVKIKSYYSSSKVPNMINIPQHQWSTTGNGYYVISIEYIINKPTPLSHNSKKYIKTINEYANIFVPQSSALGVLKEFEGNTAYTLPSGFYKIYVINENSESKYSYIKYDGQYGYVNTAILNVIKDDYIHRNELLNSDANNLSKLKKQNLLILNNIDKKVNAAPKGSTDAQMLENSNKAYTLWNTQLNKIYTQLEYNLLSNKGNQLQYSEIEWINLKNSKDKKLSQQGGSISGVEVAQNMVHMTKLRCYELVNNYM